MNIKINNRPIAEISKEDGCFNLVTTLDSSMNEIYNFNKLISEESYNLEQEIKSIGILSNTKIVESFGYKSTEGIAGIAGAALIATINRFYDMIIYILKLFATIMKILANYIIPILIFSLSKLRKKANRFIKDKSKELDKYIKKCRKELKAELKRQKKEDRNRSNEAYGYYASSNSDLIDSTSLDKQMNKLFMRLYKLTKHDTDDSKQKYNALILYALGKDGTQYVSDITNHISKTYPVISEEAAKIMEDADTFVKKYAITEGSEKEKLVSSIKSNTAALKTKVEDYSKEYKDLNTRVKEALENSNKSEDEIGLIERILEVFEKDEVSSVAITDILRLQTLINKFQRDKTYTNLERVKSSCQKLINEAKKSNVNSSTTELRIVFSSLADIQMYYTNTLNEIRTVTKLYRNQSVINDYIYNILAGE